MVVLWWWWWRFECCCCCCCCSFLVLFSLWFFLLLLSSSSRFLLRGRLLLAAGFFAAGFFATGGTTVSSSSMTMTTMTACCVVRFVECFRNTFCDDDRTVIIIIVPLPAWYNFLLSSLHLLAVRVAASSSCRFFFFCSTSCSDRLKRGPTAGADLLLLHPYGCLRLGCRRLSAATGFGRAGDTASIIRAQVSSFSSLVMSSYSSLLGV